jgi:predicted heme/steroid binding protein
MELREFTAEELVYYNGKNGQPAYIAYQGKVYDVSLSVLWRNGKHQVFHSAGKDLTEKLIEAPHDVSMLDRFPIIGIYKS